MEQNLFGINESVFIADTDKTHYPRLNQDIHVDLAIIGGGIAGITLAYLLKHSGLKVAVVEKNHIAQGMSSKSMSQITVQENLIYNQLMHRKSPGKAKKYADISKKAAVFVKELIKREHIDCDLVDMPSYIYTEEEEGIKKLKDELEVCKRLGITLEYKEELPIDLPIKAALKWEEAALFHPRKYLLQLAEAFVLAGGKIYEETYVISVRAGRRETDKSVGPKANTGANIGISFGIKVTDKLGESHKHEILLSTEDGVQIYAKSVVITCKLPEEEQNTLYFPQTEDRCTQVIAVKVKPDSLPRGSFHSIDRCGYFIRPMYEKRLILIGNRDEIADGQQVDFSQADRLCELAEKLFKTKETDYHWMVQEDTTFDGLPYIGYLCTGEHLPIYGAIGLNGNEIVGGTTAALVLRDKLLMDASEYEDLFNPKRADKYLL